MNTGLSGSIGHVKHRKAFGHQPVSRDVKLHIQRAANARLKKRPKAEMYGSVAELMAAERAKKR